MSGPPQPPQHCLYLLANVTGSAAVALCGLQVIAALFLCAESLNPHRIKSAERAARVCNFLSLMLMMSTGFFVYSGYFGRGCFYYYNPMFGIIPVFLAFVWRSRAMGYKKRARLLRYNQSLLATSSDPLLRQQGPRDLNAPDISDDSAVVVAVVLAQPLGNSSSHDSEAPFVPTAAKPVAIWEGDIEEV